MLQISCNIGTSDLPDMYAQSRGLRARFGHTYQANHSCLCYNYYVYYLWTYIQQVYIVDEI